MKGLSHCLWFDKEAEEAARFYTSVFKNSKMGRVTKYSGAGTDVHGQPEGKVMTAEFELEGIKYVGLNGGPIFKHNESFSIVVNCETQEELDYYYDALVEGGQPSECGWLKDRFGVSWQISPTALQKMLTDPDLSKVQRVTNAFLKMKRFNLAELQRVYEGK